MYHRLLTCSFHRFHSHGIRSQLNVVNTDMYQPHYPFPQPPGAPLPAIEIPILGSIQVIAIQFERIPIAQFTIASVAVAAGGPEMRASVGSELTVGINIQQVLRKY